MVAKKRAAKKVAKKPKPRIEVYEAVEQVKQGAKKTDAFVRKHPWESVGIAALTGAVIAKLLFGRRR